MSGQDWSDTAGTHCGACGGIYPMHYSGCSRLSKPSSELVFPGMMTAGLTKREYFAAMAPSEIPEWFLWTGTNFQPDLTRVHGCSQQERSQEHQRQAKEAKYFAWRAYYADGVIAALNAGAKP